jgi:anti-sigma factor RsiW
MIRHLSDAELMAWLDGECGFAGHIRVRLHLFRCWSCRGRAAELETEAHRVAHAIHGGGKALRSQQAKARFESWRWRYEQTAVPATRSTPHRLWIVIGFTAMLLVLAGGVLHQRWEVAQLPVRQVPAPRPPEFAYAKADVPPAPEVRRIEDGLTRELDVHYRLHRVGVCEAEPVLISKQRDGRILVSAMGPPAEREAEIRTALADLVLAGQVKLKITPPLHDALIASGTGAPAAKAHVSPAMRHSALAGKFGSPDRFLETVDRALAASDHIYANAWALRRHQQLPQPATDSNAFWLRHAMVNDHLGKLREALGVLKRELKPLLRRSRLEMQMNHRDTFDLASELNTGLQDFFQSEDPADMNPSAPGPDKLWATIEALDLRLAELAVAAAKSHPETTVSK